jgi:hypothetical protein
MPVNMLRTTSVLRRTDGAVQCLCTLRAFCLEQQLLRMALFIASADGAGQYSSHGNTNQPKPATTHQLRLNQAF